MPYYPKNKVSPSQYTRGNEYVFASSGKDYIGYYYKAFDGKYFTGQTPSYNDFELVPKSVNSPGSDDYLFVRSKANRILNILNPDLKSLPQTLLPKPSVVFPTNEDYANGFFTRYFAKRINTNPITIFEISQQTYNDLFNKSPKYNFALYEVTRLPWQITGQLETTTENGIITRGVRQVNMETVQQANLVFIGIDQYLTDYTEFYQ
jgi:hypothetical protein